MFLFFFFSIFLFFVVRSDRICTVPVLWRLVSMALIMGRHCPYVHERKCNIQGSRIGTSACAPILAYIEPGRSRLARCKPALISLAYTALPCIGLPGD